MTHFALGFGVLMFAIGMAIGDRFGYRRARDAYVAAALRRMKQREREARTDPPNAPQIGGLRARQRGYDLEWGGRP